LRCSDAIPCPHLLTAFQTAAYSEPIVTPFIERVLHSQPDIITPAPSTLSNPHQNNEDDTYQTLSSFPSSDFASVLGLPEGKALTASRCIAAVRRWIIYAAREFGPVERWGEDLSLEWDTVRQREPPAVHGWLQGVKRRIKMGRSALSYLECAMEGELSSGIEDWRDLYIQSHQLAAQLWGGTLGIEHRLEEALSGKVIPS
jgi:hypothetical protein